MSEYRFSTVTSPGNGETTIYRGKVYRLPSEWTTDSWSHYFDGDTFVGFTVHYWRGTPDVTPLVENDDNERAMAAYLAMHKGRPGSDEALDRLAVRLTGTEEARFISVGLDRDYDAYVLSYDGDPSNEFRNEIEALYYGDIWRIEVEEFDGTDWHPYDDVCEEYYGEDKAREGFEKEFPLDAFPAEVLVGSDGS